MCGYVACEPTWHGMHMHMPWGPIFFPHHCSQRLSRIVLVRVVLAQIHVRTPKSCIDFQQTVIG